MSTIPAQPPVHPSGNAPQPNVSYPHNGYQIRIYFNGPKTLTQCIKNLAERKLLT